MGRPGGGEEQHTAVAVSSVLSPDDLPVPSFRCQRCSVPLRLDPSLRILDNNALKTLEEIVYGVEVGTLGIGQLVAECEQLARPDGRGRRLTLTTATTTTPSPRLGDSPSPSSLTQSVPASADSVKSAPAPERIASSTASLSAPTLSPSSSQSPSPATTRASTSTSTTMAPPSPATSLDVCQSESASVVSILSDTVSKSKESNGAVAHLTNTNASVRPSPLNGSNISDSSSNGIRNSRKGRLSMSTNEMRSSVSSLFRRQQKRFQHHQHSNSLPSTSLAYDSSNLNSNGSVHRSSSASMLTNSAVTTSSVLPASGSSTGSDSPRGRLTSAALGKISSSLGGGHGVGGSKAFILSHAFQLLSDATGYDFPMCSDCTAAVALEMEGKLERANTTNDQYRRLLDTLEEEERRNEEISKQLDDEISSLVEGEERLKDELARIDREMSVVCQEMSELEHGERKLEALRDRYWQTYHECEYDSVNCTEQWSAYHQDVRRTEESLLRLKKTNVFNDAFHIWFDGHFGTINSFRLGRLPSQPVDLQEINAAWGYLALLLHTLSEHLGFKFSTYRIVPNGSQSRIEKVDDNTSYDLFCSNDISFGQLFWYRSFDNGMVAYLTCVSELAKFAESQGSVKIPYEMGDGKIGDLSVRIRFNSDQAWTKAMKYLLTNLKWIVAWMTKTSKDTTFHNR
eukprot:TRINITY_DN5228_c0_g1_i1.p1 TRINITY_DN5228_c0_g1~~TRINITY_DN5228_c0_g1_i1.p1  ORF type:complete len:684 (+),score=123.88 TRINITY_DN5228_c0_g1_i1:299-2350(+)